MDILAEIISHKRKEVEDRKALYPVRLLEQSIYFSSPPVQLTKYLLREDKSGIIAEIKRKSPSKGLINPYISIERTSIGYMQAGASALSVLTDHHYFGGSNDDLTQARKFNFCPILRKDFIVDEYQIIEAKSIGADAILLIASALSSPLIKDWVKLAHSLNLQVLLEVHSKNEVVENLDSGADLIGVNNRDLKTFEVNVEVSRQLAPHIPEKMIKVSESGIESPKVIAELSEYGYKGFIIGQNFMQHNRPELAAREFIKNLRRNK